MTSTGCCVQALAGSCPTYNELLVLANCNAVGVGQLCEGDGECGTSNALNNCPVNWDVYTRVVCTPPPPPIPPPPPLPSPPPPPPQVECTGNMQWRECGSGCNSTCTEPSPMCTMQCVPRCQCPLETPVWHDHLGTCGTTTQCLTPATSAASGGFYANDPCETYVHTQNTTTAATGWYHTGRAQMFMFAGNVQDCCNRCNEMNDPAKPPPPPSAPPNPPPPSSSIIFGIGALPSFEMSHCHGIHVSMTTFGASCQFYHRRLDGTMGTLIPRDTPASLTYSGGANWYTVPFPPPPPHEPPSPSPPPPGAPPATAVTIGIASECPKTKPIAGSSCANYNESASSCAYDFYCCPSGSMCMNLTFASCPEGTWQIALSAVNCPDSSPFLPPPPPMPSAPPNGDISPAMIIVISAIAVVAVGTAAVAIYFVLTSGASSTKAAVSGASKPLLASATSSAVERPSLAAMPSWTFDTLGASNKR